MSIQNGISASYLAYIDDFLRDRGGNPALAYSAAGMNMQSLARQSSIIAVEPLSLYLLNVASQVNEPGMCFDIGSYISVTSHGPLGLAMLTSQNLNSVLNLWISYASIAAPMVRPTVEHDDGEVIVNLHIDKQLTEFHPIIVEVLLGVIKSNTKILTAKTFKLNSVSVSYSAPSHAKYYEKALGCPTYFDQAIDQIRFDAALLMQPLTMTNPAGELWAINQCEQALAEANGAMPLAQEVKSILALVMDKSPTVARVANSLNMSERTLRRKLSDEGISFRQLLQDVRFEAAKRYLLQSNKYIEEISFDLGYNETSNFRSAFKAWSGLSPSQWRLENKI